MTPPNVRAAQVSWSSLAVHERLRPVAELRHLLVERRDSLAAAVEADVGRPAGEVISTDILPCAAACKFLQRHAERLLRPRRVGRPPLWLWGCADVVYRRPFGVVGVIGTWNYPLFLNVVPIVQALTAGNAVRWKPSENTPRTANALAQLFRDAGYPPGVFDALPATREGGAELAEGDIDFLHFTGSDAVGRKLAARLGERLIPSTLELSGCDACVVFAGADLTLAARAAWYGLTLNKGQTCLAVRRIFVERKVLEPFRAGLRELAAAGAPQRLLSPRQVEQATRLLAEAGGAERVTVPGVVGGREFAPTVVIDVAPDSGVCREATFAPLAALIPFDTWDELVELQARCPFGLGASIFAAAGNRDAERLIPRLKVGAVSVNDVIAPVAHPSTPLTGRGQSGWGATQGEEGLLAMTVPQVVTARRGRFRPHIDAVLQPLPGDAEITTGMLRLTHGRTPRERLRGFAQMVRGVWAVRRR